MRRRLVIVVLAALLIVALVATAALAGEITGNGQSLKNADGTLNGRSACAFSGQEDDQWNNDPFVRGDPAHAQSWGQIPKDIRDEIAQFGFHPGDACNPNIGEPTNGG